MSAICKTCRKPKANFNCGICEETICKSCASFVGEDQFSFLKVVPAELSHPTYCSQCFDEKVSAPLNEYNETMEKAREVIVFNKDQNKLTRFLSRREDPCIVENCEDEQETIMRMAFMAVQLKQNALLDVKVDTKKIIVGSHKKTIFNGSSIPTTVDLSKIRDDY